MSMLVNVNHFLCDHHRSQLNHQWSMRPNSIDHKRTCLFLCYIPNEKEIDLPDINKHPKKSDK